MEHMTFYVQYTCILPTWLPAMWHVVGKTNLTHGTLDHVIEHGQAKGSHMTLNVQH